MRKALETLSHFLFVDTYHAPYHCVPMLKQVCPHPVFPTSCVLESTYMLIDSEAALWGSGLPWSWPW